MNLYNIPVHAQSPQRVNAVIEIPKDTNVKYEYEQTIENNFNLSSPLNAIDKENYNLLKKDLDYIN